jgi:hypothetical protein
LVSSKKTKYHAKLTLMPDYGGECLWVKQLGTRFVKDVLATDCQDSICVSLPEALESDLANWQAEFERAEIDVEAGIVLLDWPDFHQRGLLLAQRLRAELSADIGVFYQKAYEDPNEQFEEVKELLHDAELVLPPKKRRLRSGRKVPDWLPLQILSGGQSGVDRAALDWAISERIPHAGWCPKGRRAADGVLSCKYQLLETPSSGYRKRTVQNVLDSDATLIMTEGTLLGGSKLTVELCQQYHKPYLVVDLSALTISSAAEVIRDWLIVVKVKQLNVAGPSESRNPRIYQFALTVLDTLIPSVGDEDNI